LIVLYVPFFVKWKTGINPTRAVISLAWLSLVAYTQVESYVLFSLTIIILLTRSMQLRSFLTWTLLLVGPFLLELPLFVNFVLEYWHSRPTALCTLFLLEPCQHYLLRPFQCHS